MVKNKLILLGLLIFMSSCDKNHSVIENDGRPDICEGQGSGGPAILQGKITGNSGETLESSGLFIFDSNDYSDTLLFLKIDSKEGDFVISQLPETSIDIIVSPSVGYLTIKMNNVLIFTETTSISINCTPISELPPYIPNELIVEFKDVEMDTISLSNFLNKYDFSLIRKWTSSGLTERIFYTVVIPDSVTVLEMIAVYPIIWNKICEIIGVFS